MVDKPAVGAGTEDKLLQFVLDPCARLCRLAARAQEIPTLAIVLTNCLAFRRLAETNEELIVQTLLPALTGMLPEPSCTDLQLHIAGTGLSLSHS